jgi:flagellar motility protein MotE (MotC chaperone)
VQQQLALSDIEGERREIDGLRNQVADQLKHAELLIEKLNELRTRFLEEKQTAASTLQQMKHERIAIDQEHMDNTKRLSQWIQGMDPEKAATVLTTMANDGDEQLEIAVQILRNLEEREAAKILSAIEDPKLVQLLIERFRHLQKPPAKTASRK